MSKQSKYESIKSKINQHDYSQDVSDFGQKVRERREKLNLSLDKLADIISSDKSAISRIENAERIPRYDLVLKIADALETTPAKFSPDRFTGGDDDFLSQTRSKLMALPSGKRGTAIRYINALLDGLLMEENNTRR